MFETSDPKILATDAAIVDVGALQIVAVRGADRVSFLQRLATANIAGTPLGAGCRSLLLNLKGHIACEFRALVRGDDIRLIVAPGQGDATVAALSRYAVMDDVTMALVQDASLMGVFGPRTGAVLSQAGVQIPGDFVRRSPWSHADMASPFGSLWGVCASGFGTQGVWVVGPGATVAALKAALQTARVAQLAADVAEGQRIAAGDLKFGAEITADHFPMEIGLAAAIDYTKGCYLGQEPIVRIRDRGRLNWRLVRLRIPGALAPAAGDSIESDAKPNAGAVTSAALLAGGGAVALAMLHAAVPTGGDVRILAGQQVLSAHVLDEVGGPEAAA